MFALNVFIIKPIKDYLNLIINRRNDANYTCVYIWPKKIYMCIYIYIYIYIYSIRNIYSAIMQNNIPTTIIQWSAFKLMFAKLIQILHFTCSTVSGIWDHD